MTSVNVGLSSLNEVYKVLSMLDAKGISKNEISIVTPTDSQFRQLIRHEEFNNKQETMLFAWMSAIVGASLFALLSFLLLGVFSMAATIPVDFSLITVLVLLGIFLGGGSGYLVGQLIGKRKTLFKSRKIARNPKLNSSMVLQFELPEERKEEIEASLKLANPVFLQCI